MLNRLKPLFLYLVLITGFMGCQKSDEEISFPEGNIRSDSPLAFLLKNTVSFDGSFDNAIDNSSCIAVKLPVDVVVNGQQLTISGNDEILQVQQILSEQPFNFDTIQINFPVSIVRADHSEHTLNNQNDLEAERRNCTEGGLDPDIECVDFEYPISLNEYDSENQRAAVRNLNSDTDFFKYLTNLRETDIVTFDFPLSVILSDGSSQQLQNNEDLSAVIENNSNQCDESDLLFYDNISDVPFETGEITIEMTDAPFPLDLVSEVNVVIDAVEIKTDNDEETILTLSEEEFDVNLLDLTNGITVMLADLEIPEALYNEVRLSIKESTVLLTDQTVFDIKIPSDRLKVKISPSVEIDSDKPVELLLDFDVSQSFVVQGNPDTPAGIRGFIFKPVVKAANLAGTGTLAGTVTDLTSAALEGTQISVFAADTLNTTSFADANGEYKILGLLPGDYEITAELDGYVSATMPAAIVIKETAVVNFQLANN